MKVLEIVRQIKDSIDKVNAESKGIVCHYPTTVEIDGTSFSFESVLADDDGGSYAAVLKSSIAHAESLQ